MCGLPETSNHAQSVTLISNYVELISTRTFIMRFKIRFLLWSQDPLIDTICYNIHMYQIKASFIIICFVLFIYRIYFLFLSNIYLKLNYKKMIDL